MPLDGFGLFFSLIFVSVRWVENWVALFGTDSKSFLPLPNVKDDVGSYLLLSSRKNHIFRYKVCLCIEDGHRKGFSVFAIKPKFLTFEKASSKCGAGCHLFELRT